MSILDSSINAPPSFRPAKKYSDISGLPVRFNFAKKKCAHAHTRAPVYVCVCARARARPYDTSYERYGGMNERFIL